MDEQAWTCGAGPRAGIGPREGLPPGVSWPGRRGEDGGPTEWQTRSGAYRRVGGGLWVRADVALTTDQRIVEAAAQLPPHGGVTGWASLRWQGASWFDGTQRSKAVPVPLALGVRHSLRPRPGIQLSQELVPPAELVRQRGLRLTGPLWSVAFEMRKAARDVDALMAFEMAAYADLVSVAELADFVASALWIRQGVQRVRDLLPHLDANAWSPMESLMRWTWCSAGFPRPRTNHPVFDLGGRFVGTPDLIDLEAGVFGLYDGALHLAGEVRHRDVVAEAAYRALGLEGATMMAGDLGDPSAFVVRLHQAYARAQRRPTSQRAWLPGVPAWWVPTGTVAQRRGLTASERSRYLRYRRAA